MKEGWEVSREGGKGTTWMRKECALGKEVKSSRVSIFECSLFRVVVAISPDLGGGKTIAWRGGQSPSPPRI